MLIGSAASRSGLFEESTDHLRLARANCANAGDPFLEAELELTCAFTAFAAEDLEEAKAFGERGLLVLDSPRAVVPEEGAVPAAHIRVRIHELLYVLTSAKGRCREGIETARFTFALSCSDAVGDVFHQAFALRNLAIVAQDLDLALDVRAVSKRVGELGWTSDVAQCKFSTTEALGWYSALRGDTVDALRRFRVAESCATSIPQHVIIAATRATLASESGHRAMQIEEIEHGLRLARSFDWNGAPCDYRGGLLALAEVAAAVSPLDARAMLDRYAGIRTAMDPRCAARIEPRARAYQAYVEGIVLRAEGQLDAATQRLRVAYDVWQAGGYEWTAARAAAELAELGGGDAFRQTIRHELSVRPDSIFAERLRTIA